MNLNGTTLLLAIIGHLVGDYLLQNDWQALNKKKVGNPNFKLCSEFCIDCICVRVFSLHCAAHCLLWSLAVCVLAGWFSPLVFSLLFVTHYAQDRTDIVSWWMDLIGQKQFRTGVCAPWSVIVVDNVWHIVTLFLVWRFIV